MTKEEKVSRLIDFYNNLPQDKQSEIRASLSPDISKKFNDLLINRPPEIKSPLTQLFDKAGISPEDFKQKLDNYEINNRSTFNNPNIGQNPAEPGNISQNPLQLLANPGKGNFIEKTLPVVGASIGGGAGTPLGPIGAIGGGMLGAAAGESIVQAERATRGLVPPNPAVPLSSIAKEAALGGIGEGIASQTSKIVQELVPTENLIKAGSAIIKTFSGVPKRLTEQALKGALKDAPTIEEAQSLYKTTLKNVGLPVDEENLFKKFTGRLLQRPSDYENLVESGLQEIANKEPNIEKVLAARQAASKLERSTRFESSEQRVNLGEIIKSKDKLDGFLNEAVPGFSEVNDSYRKAVVREAFSQLLPINNNSALSALRTMLGFGMAYQISPATILLSSPLAAGVGIRLGSALFSDAPIASLGSQTFIRSITNK